MGSQEVGDFNKTPKGHAFHACAKKKAKSTQSSGFSFCFKFKGKRV
jgi:hypothetical protein